MKQVISLQPAKRLALLQLIAQTIFDKKGKNIAAFDVRNISNLTDFCLVAEGQVDKHVQAICGAIQDFLQLQGEKPFRVEGKDFGSWIVLDYADMMIHLFEPSERARYQIEQLWHAAEIIELTIDMEAKQRDEGNLYSLPQ